MKIVSRINREIHSNYRFSTHFSNSQTGILVAKGREIGLDDTTTMDMICAGSRKGKPIPMKEMLQQMENYARTVEPRGYPFLFRSIEHFASFKRQILSTLRQGGIPIGDVRIHGSSLRSPNAKDVDLLAVLAPNEFKPYLQSHNQTGRLKIEAQLDAIKKAFQLEGLDLLIVAEDTYYPNRPYLNF